MTELEKQISDLIFAISMAEDVAQFAEDHGRLSRAGEVRSQILELNKQLLQLRNSQKEG